MKRLLLLVLPLCFAASFAGDEQVKGRVRSVMMGTDVIVRVDTLGGFKDVYLGTAEQWRGKHTWIDRGDLFHVSGRKDPDTARIIPERMWLNGGFYMLPTTVNMDK